MLGSSALATVPLATNSPTDGDFTVAPSSTDTGTRYRRGHRVNYYPAIWLALSWVFGGSSS